MTLAPQSVRRSKKRNRRMTRLRRRPLGGGSLEAHYIYNIMEEKCRFLWEDKVDFECRIEAPGAHQHLFFF